jgi:nitrite reductase/ring-hydroxylating ferredoxin subunit
VTTLEGPGAGSEIRVRLTPRAPKETGVEVEFHVHEHRPERLEMIGARYVDVYRRLWDEDEAMMIARERALGRRKRRSMSSNAPKTLGALADVRAQLPFVVSFGGEQFRLVDLDGAIVAHAATCPHWLGPLDDAAVEGGRIVCPWHGYAFDVASGESCDGRALRLAAPPRVLVADGVVRLEAAR